MNKEIYKGHTIEIEQDDYSNSREWDNLGTMICFHKGYDLGDKHDLKSNDFNSWDEIESYIKKEYDPAVILPLYLYDHSGLRIKTGSFQGLLPQGHAEFDSGQVGFIYVSKEKARKEYGWKSITKARIKKLAEYLTQEVETYDQDISGDVWVYIITKEDDPEVHEVLGGLYGYDYALQEAKDMVDYLVEEEQKNNGIQQELQIVS